MGARIFIREKNKFFNFIFLTLFWIFYWLPRRLEEQEKFCNKLQHRRSMDNLDYPWGDSQHIEKTVAGDGSSVVTVDSTKCDKWIKNNLLNNGMKGKFQIWPNEWIQYRKQISHLNIWRSYVFAKSLPD